MPTETQPQVPIPLCTSSNRTSIDATQADDVKKSTRSNDNISHVSEPDQNTDVEKGTQDAPQPESGESSLLVEFDGPNDPANPKNWSVNQRRAITISMSLLVFNVTFASSIFSVNIEVVRQKFDVSVVVATLGVALFVLVWYFPNYIFEEVCQY